MFFIVICFIIIAGMRVTQSICTKRVSNEVEDTKIFFLYTFYYQLLAAVFSFITVCFSGFSGLTLQTILCGAITAIFLMIGFYAGLMAIKHCKLIVCTMFQNGGLLISCLLSWRFFHESMSVFQGIGLLLFFISAYLLSSTKKSEGRIEKQKIGKGTWVLLIVSMLAEGGVEISQKYFSLNVQGGNIAWYSFFMFLCSAAAMAIGLLFMQAKKKDNLNDNASIKVCRLNKSLYLCGILLAFAIFVINFLITTLGKQIDTVILFPVSASITTCMTLLVGWCVYKEKLTIKNVVGVILGLISIIVLSTFTPEIVAKLYGGIA